ncbi:hypothetical protein BH11MYX1_BH11MYX1_08600 [soil metagenome]
MRQTMVVITMFGCAAPMAPIPTPTRCPALVVATEPAAPSTKQCPLQLRGEMMPGVASFATAAEATAHMPALAQGGAPDLPDLNALGKRNAGAFFSTVPRGYLHESVTGLEYVHAVFVQPKRYTVVSRVIERVHPMPEPTQCPAAVLEPGTGEIAIINPHLGHFRITRWSDHGELTTPVVPATAASASNCASKARIRVEDHFIDLDSGEHLRAFVQIYETDPRNPGTPELYAFDAFTPMEGGIEIAASSCSYFWND